MNKKSITATFDDDAPITQDDIHSGKLVLRKRDETGAVLPSRQALADELKKARDAMPMGVAVIDELRGGSMSEQEKDKQDE